MKKLHTFGFVAILAIYLCMLCVGCASTLNYSFDLEALSVEDNSKQYAYTILPSDKSVNDSDLMFIKLKNKLKESLVENGFAVAEDVEKANAIILFSATISEPNTKIVGTGGGTQRSSYNQYTKQTTTYKDDTYNIYSTTYKRTINLEVYEYNPSSKKQGQILWKMEVLSEGTSNDLQKVFNYAVKAMEKYYGQDSSGRKKVTVEVNEDTGDIIKIEIN